MLRTGGILLNLLYNYINNDNVSQSTTMGEGYKEIEQKNKKLVAISTTLASYGGIFTKFAQLLCYDTENCSAYSDCKPINQKETIDYLKLQYGTNKEFFKNVKSLDFEVLKAGSVGQIHKGIYNNSDDINNDKHIIIKVQYYGLSDHFKEDLILIETLTSYLFYFMDLKESIFEIKKKLMEELDYKLEFNNQQLIYNLWETHEYIKIPALIPELCTDNLLGMEFIDGEILNVFIENSTQEQRNFIGNLIVNFIFVNFFKYGIYYSDIHYGNFIVKNKNLLYIIDFGCIHNIESDVLYNLKALYKVILDNNKDEFFIIVKKMNILKDTTPEKSKEYMYDYFKIIFLPWTSNEFEFTQEWLDVALYKEIIYMKDWNLPGNLVYLNKIAYGFYYLCTKLKLNGNFAQLINELTN
jgi:predicted unusual protein kinase regulating ubiquinone biosynthesis (AarF/ABC1/UbiB family)